MNKPKIITKEQFSEICYQFAEKEMQYDEPIPEITQDSLDKVETCLKKPLNGSANGHLFYPTVAEQATAIFYCICKNHPFTNGNKRLALITVIIFLLYSGYWLKKKFSKIIYLLAVGTASIEGTKNGIAKEALKDFFENSIEETDKSIENISTTHEGLKLIFNNQ